MNVANKMADKKKNASQSQSQAAEQKAQDGEQGQGKRAKAVTRTWGEERKGSESKTVTRPRETNRPGSKKAPSETLTRLRSNRIMRFLFESYYELRYKVTWPTPEEARNMTFVVIALSVAVGLILGLADLALSQLYLLILHWAGV